MTKPKVNPSIDLNLIDSLIKQYDEEVTKMNVNIPKDFYKKIKQRALDEDTTVTEIVLKALRQYLNR